jgi:hypothetical protein
MAMSGSNAASKPSYHTVIAIISNQAPTHYSEQRISVMYASTSSKITFVDMNLNPNLEETMEQVAASHHPMYRMIYLYLPTGQSDHWTKTIIIRINVRDRVDVSENKSLDPDPETTTGKKTMPIPSPSKH